MHNQQLQQKANLGQTKAITCDKCGGMYFTQVLHIRKQSGLLSGSDKPTIIPIPVFQCTSCGHVNKEFLPTILKEEEELK